MPVFRAAVLLAVFAAAMSVSSVSAQAATSPWRVSPSPNPGTDGHNTLNSVAAVSTTDAWAVGWWNDSTGSGPLVERWDGTQWTVVNVPVAMPGDFLENVSAPSASNVTITGLYGSGLVILHYNGVSWTRTTPPIPLNAPEGFERTDPMASLSASDVWVGHGRGFLDRWNGRGWKGIPTAPATSCPTVDYGFWIGAIQPISDTDVWFDTGQVCGLVPGSGDHSNLDQWNGSKVIHHGAPSGPAGQTITSKRPAGIAVTGSDAWMVGNWDDYDPLTGGAGGPLAGFWNGSKWTSPVPSYPDSGHFFTALAAASPTSVWAVGGRDGASPINATYNLLEHWNGSTWNEWGGPNPTAYNGLQAVAAVPHSTQLWAVGWTGGDPTDSITTSQTMILHCCN